MSVSWRPILSGLLMKRAFAAIRGIAVDIPNHLPLSPDASLAGGQAGLAVAYAYFARAGCADSHKPRAFLEQAVHAASSGHMEPSLHSGLTGVGWAVVHLRKQGLTSGMASVTNTIDRTLSSCVSQSPRPHEYDLLCGLVGLGVYAIERLPEPAAVDCLKQIVDRLEELAVRSESGVAFLTPPAKHPNRRRDLPYEGYYDIGIAHGISGVIAFLSVVCARHIANEKARRLLKDAIKWLLRQEMSNQHLGAFPYRVAPGMKRERARLAWCYGDAGVASALHLASRALRNPAWAREALRLARLATCRPPYQARIVDAGLCHGASGLAHIFNRLFQATGKRWLRDAAQFWFEYVLGMRHLGHGIAGFSSFAPDDRGAVRWVDEPGFLEGAAGVALALLAATTSIEPEWDRTLLLSLPADPARKGAA